MLVSALRAVGLGLLGLAAGFVVKRSRIPHNTFEELSLSAVAGLSAGTGGLTLFLSWLIKRYQSAR